MQGAVGGVVVGQSGVTGRPPVGGGVEPRCLPGYPPVGRKAMHRWGVGRRVSGEKGVRRCEARGQPAGMGEGLCLEVHRPQGHRRQGGRCSGHRAPASGVRQGEGLRVGGKASQGGGGGKGRGGWRRAAGRRLRRIATRIRRKTSAAGERASRKTDRRFVRPTDIGSWRRNLLGQQK